MADALEDLSNSSVFNFLDALVASGKLTASRVEVLKSKFSKMHEVYLRVNRHELALLEEAVALEENLKGKKEEYAVVSEQSQATKEQIEKLKEEYGEADNKSREIEERMRLLHYETQDLSANEKILRDEYEERLREEEEAYRPQIQSLQQGCEQLRDEISSIKDSVKKEEEEKQALLDRVDVLQSKFDELEEQKREAAMRLARVENEPTVAKRQADQVNRGVESRNIELQKLFEQERQLDEELKRLQERRLALEEESCERRLDFQGSETDYLKLVKQEEEVRNKIVAFKVDIETAQEKKSDLLAHDESLSDQLHKEKESLSRLEREKERIARRQLKLDTVIEGLSTIKFDLGNRLDTLKEELADVERARKKAASEMRELHKDWEILLCNTLEKSEKGETTSAHLRELLDNLAKIEEEIARLADQERQLRQEVQEKVNEREAASRAATRANEKRKAARKELYYKEAEITELMREQAQQELKMDGVHKKFVQARREKNNYQKSIQQTEQRLAEMREKNKIVENELDVFNKESFSKDKDMAQSRRKRAKVLKDKEALRSLVDKQRALHNEKKLSINQAISEVERLNGVINRMEDEMLRLKKKFEQSVEERNYTGIQLIDRNDELCILHEKANLQESISQNGELALRTREEELRQLSVESRDALREIELCQRLLPEVEELQWEIGELRKELMFEQAVSEFYSEQLESTENQARWRKLEGRDPDPRELRRKISVLEDRLNSRKEQGLEKDLLLDQLTRASDKIRTRALSEREKTLDTAKTINEQQYRLKKKTRQMMATISELSLYQASAMSLERTKAELSEKLRDAQERLESGEAPDESADEEFMRIEEQRRRHRELILRRQEEARIQREMPATVVRSTAEPRPNAYIPDDELGIPQPYGGLAPFKPTEPGAGMRHIRKPQPPEIEI